MRSKWFSQRSLKLARRSAQWMNCCSTWNRSPPVRMSSTLIAPVHAEDGIVRVMWVMWGILTDTRGGRMGLSGVPCDVGQSRSRKCTRSDSPNQHKADECPAETNFGLGGYCVYMLFICLVYFLYVIYTTVSGQTECKAYLVQWNYMRNWYL